MFSVGITVMIRTLSTYMKLFISKPRRGLVFTMFTCVRPPYIFKSVSNNEIAVFPHGDWASKRSSFTVSPPCFTRLGSGWCQ